MQAIKWHKEPGLQYDKQVEVVATGVGLFGRSAIILHEDTGKLEKIHMKKLKILINN